MRKEWILIVGCLLSSTLLSAETMQFVTRMSAPVGVFQEVGAWSTAQVTNKLTLRNAGDITMNGTIAEFGNVTLSANAGLNTENVGMFRTNNFTVNGSGNLQGESMLVYEVKGNNSGPLQIGVAATLYSGGIASKYVKTDKFEIKDTAYMERTVLPGDTLQWTTNTNGWGNLGTTYVLLRGELPFWLPGSTPANNGHENVQSCQNIPYGKFCMAGSSPTAPDHGACWGKATNSCNDGTFNNVSACYATRTNTCNNGTYTNGSICFASASNTCSGYYDGTSYCEQVGSGVCASGSRKKNGGYW